MTTIYGMSDLENLNDGNSADEIYGRGGNDLETGLSVSYVGFWRRFVAIIIDNIFISLIFLLLALFVPGMELVHTVRHDEVPGAQSTHSIRYNDSVAGEHKSNTTLEWKVQMTSGQWLIVSCLYTVGFWICKRATPGKRIIRAKIIDARTGGWPTNAQFLVRYIGYIILALPLWLGFIWVSLPLCLGFIWAAFDKRKQGWHDKIARTIVIDG